MSVAATRDLGATLNASAEEAPKRILLVDDAPETFADLKAALTPDGAAWRVEYAADGDAALATLQREPVDVVIVEDQMAAMDGVTLLTRVRDQHPTTIRMIVSATTKPGLATTVSHRFLSKPCNVDELAVLIKRSCALHERTDGVTHAHLGAHLLSLWGLPDGIVEAVAHHHDPGSVDGFAFDGVAAVHIANGLANEIAPERDGEPPRAGLDVELLDRLGLRPRLDVWRGRARQLADLVEESAAAPR